MFGRKGPKIRRLGDVPGPWSLLALPRQLEGDEPMICRVALHEKPPGSVASDEARSFREWLKELPGFIAGYHVQDSETGRMLSITIRDSEERLTEHEDRTPPGGPLGIHTERLELFDVVEEF
jgi:hypothetical protein